ncbi:MAG: ATP-binding protein [Phycisphaerae bacterium]|nr:ATP-binding protein [Phycisphaerae bacterium]
MKITKKLTFGFLIIALLPLMIIAIVGIKQQGEIINRLSFVDAIDVARTIEKSISIESETLPFVEKGKLQKYVETLSQTIGRDIVVVDLNKIIIADIASEIESIGEEFTYDLGDEVRQTMRDGKPRVFKEISEDVPEGVSLVVVPLAESRRGDQKAGQIIGAVIVSYKPADLTGFKLTLLFTTVFVIISVTISGLLFSRSIYEPIVKLKDAAIEMGKGKLSTQIQVKSDDEIGQLAEAFNEMAGDLTQTIDNLNTVNKQLEQEVVDRKKAEQEKLSIIDRIKRQESAIVKIATNDALATGNINTTMRVITEITADTLKSERVGVWLLKEAGTKLECIDLFESSTGKHSNEMSLFMDDYPHYFAALKQGRAIDANDALTDARTAELVEGYLIPLDIKSMLDTPIRMSGEVVGVVCHESTNSKRIWNSDEITFASEIADQTAQVLINIERKKAEENLSESVSLLTATLESTADGILVVDGKGSIKGFNDQFIKLWRIPDDIIRSKDDNRAISFVLGQLTDPDAFVSKVQYLYENPALESSDTLEFKDGRIFERLSKPQIVDNTVVGRVWSFRDVTGRRKADSQLESANANLAASVDKLERTNTELKNFLYAASHDLKEPLRKITSFGVMLKKSLAGKLTDDDAENLHFMTEGASHMTKMVEGLLTYSRIDTKAQPAEAVDLNHVVEQLRQFEFAEAIKEKQAIIEVPGPLPNIDMDPVQIRQLMYNLIANSVKYQKEGNTPHIAITSRPAADGKVKIEVTDNGIGIAPEYQQAIFNIFKRLHSRDEYEGIGIGLAVCKKIVEKHGGKIGVESQPGNGTTFWFTVPQAKITVKAGVKIA